MNAFRFYISSFCFAAELLSGEERALLRSSPFLFQRDISYADFYMHADCDLANFIVSPLAIV
jgi:hypothetical protein